MTTQTRPSPRVSLGSQAVLLTAATALSQLGTAVMYAIAARSADPRAFGVVVASMAVGMTAAGLLDFGSNSYLVREFASGRMVAEEIYRRVLAKLQLVALAGTVTVAFSWSLFRSEVGLVAGTVCLGVVLSQAMAIGLRSAVRSDLVGLMAIVERVAGIGVMALLMVANVPSPTALWIGLLAGSAVSAGFAVAAAPASHRFRWVGRTLVNPYGGSSGFGWAAVAGSVQASDVALVSALGSPGAAGVYGAVNRWTQPMGLAVGAFSQSAAPIVAAADSWLDAWLRVRRSLWLLGLALIACLVTAAAAPIVVRVVLGDKYADSSTVLAILALGTIPAIVNQPLAVFLQFRGYQRQVAIFLITGTIFQLGALLVLVPAFGARGAAMAFGALQVVVLGELSWSFLHNARRQNP